MVRLLLFSRLETGRWTVSGSKSTVRAPDDTDLKQFSRGYVDILLGLLLAKPGAVRGPVNFKWVAGVVHCKGS